MRDLRRPVWGRLLLFLVFIALAMAAPAVPAHAAPPGQSIVTVTTTEDLRLRAGPGLDYGQIGSVPKGTTLDVLGRNDLGTWANVTYQGQNGWIAVWYTNVSGDILTIRILQSTATPQNATQTATQAPAPSQSGSTTLTAVTTVDLRIRSGPDITYTQIGVAPHGTSLTVLGRDEAARWVYSEYQGTRGWLAAWYLTISGGTLASAPVTTAQGNAAVPAAAPTATATPAPQQQVSGISATPRFDLRIRSGPGTTYPQIGTAPVGFPLPVNGRNEAGSWVLIDYHGTPGWIAAWYCDLNTPINQIPVASAGVQTVTVRSITAWEYHDTQFALTYDIRMRPQWFEDQLRWLQQNGYHALTAEELATYLNGGSVPDKSIVLTFDLGKAQMDDYEYTVSLLQQYGMHGIFFMVTGSINDDCSGNWPCWSALQRWKATGAVSFGSHTVNHPSFGDLTQDQIRWELATSKQQLEDHGLGPIVAFAYPFEYATTYMAGVMVDLGYQYAFGGNSRSGDPGLHPYDGLRWNLPRLLPYSADYLYPVLSSRADGRTFPEMVTTYTSP